MVSDKFTMPASPVGIIEALTSGFEIVAAHLQVLLLPLAIDLFLWVGPRVTLRPAWSRIEDFFTLFVQSTDGESQQRFIQTAKLFHDMAQAAPDRFLPILLPPTLFGGRHAGSLPFDFKPLVLQTFSGSMAGIVLAVVGGLILCEVYCGWIAFYVVDEAPRFWSLARQLFSVVVQTFLAIGLAVFIAIVSVLMLSVLSVMLQLIGVSGDAADSLVGWLILVVIFIFIVPFGMMLVFTIHGMFLNRRNIFGAMWDSIRVVQWNMMPTFMLFVLVVGIYVAMRIIWALASSGSWLSLAAIGGNSFITTGLIAATFVYFKDRYRYWREIREELLAELERRRAQQDNNRQI
jgi:hypothetical protein